MFALNIDPANPGGNPEPSELNDLGVSAVRYTYKDDSRSRRPSPEVFRFYRRQMEQYQAAGIDSLVILSYETLPGAPNLRAPAASWFDYLIQFQQRVKQLVTNLADLQPSLQIWNEPDLPPQPGYAPTVSPRIYAQLLDRCYQTIKQINPALTVITAGLASGIPDWLVEVGDAAGQGAIPADAVSVHPYDKRPSPNWPTPTWGSGYVIDLLNAYRQVSSLPLVVTEAGTNAFSPGGQAEFLRRFYDTMGRQSDLNLQATYWFCYSDRMVPGYGLLGATGQPRPAYLAYRQLAQAWSTPLSGV